MSEELAKRAFERYRQIILVPPFTWDELHPAEQVAWVEVVAAALATARADERERCERVADDYDTGGFGTHQNMVIAQTVSAEILAAIRALPLEPAK